MKTITLFRPVGPDEFRLIEQSNFSVFPPRLPEQPIFYPVLNKEYAEQISVEWNVPAYGSGYVTEFDINEDYASKFITQNVGNETHNELWVPAAKLEEFNKNIIGKIRIISKFE